MDNGHICKDCEQPLSIVIPFRRHWAYLCNNIDCHLFAYGQVIIARPEPPVVIKVIKPKAIRTERPSYQAYKKKRQQNYHILLNLGIRSTIAAGMTSNSRTALAVEHPERYVKL